MRAALDANDAHLRPWIPFMRSEPRTLAQTEAWLVEIVEAFDAGSALRYAVWSPEDDLLGEVMLLARAGPGALELGYWMTEPGSGHGYATEAAHEMLRLAFEDLGTKQVVMRCDVDNAASRAVARKLGARVAARESMDEPEGPVILEVWTLEREARAEGSVPA